MDAEVGDRIALLEGGNVPYILRQKLGQENEWLIIGDLTFMELWMGKVGSEIN
jgi:hypothetical protein